MINDLAVDRGNTTLAAWTRNRGVYVWPLPAGPIVPPTPGTPVASPTVPVGPTSTPVAPTATPAECAINFSDVHPTDYFYTPVRYLVCNGVISGYADNTFRPYNNTTRSQMVKIVVLGYGIPITTPPGGGNTFTDVPPTFPFFSVIETAAANNVVSGYACGSPGEPCDSQNRPYFRPYNNVTRGQLSKIDAIAAGWDLLNPPDATFEDVAPASPFYTFVETAVAQGVISGYGMWRPGRAVRPAESPLLPPGEQRHAGPDRQDRLSVADHGGRRHTHAVDGLAATPARHPPP